MRREESLEYYVSRKIAEIEDVKPGEITTEYVRKRRAEEIDRIYINCDGCKCLTLRELDELEKRVIFLSSF